MYEKLDTESVNIPMAKAAARSLKAITRYKLALRMYRPEQPLPFMIIQILKLHSQP